jgi:hypothetical protein
MAEEEIVKELLRQLYNIKRYDADKGIWSERGMDLIEELFREIGDELEHKKIYNKICEVWYDKAKDLVEELLEILYEEYIEGEIWQC